MLTLVLGITKALLLSFSLLIFPSFSLRTQKEWGSAQEAKFFQSYIRTQDRGGAKTKRQVYIIVHVEIDSCWRPYTCVWVWTLDPQECWNWTLLTYIALHREAQHNWIGMDWIIISLSLSIYLSVVSISFKLEESKGRVRQNHRRLSFPNIFSFFL